jgi:nucleoside-diphosphate-sugar epimerase
MADILVIGGSRYFGKHLLLQLRDAGHDVTVLNRGSTPPPEGIRQLVADRDDERALRQALGGREFDTVMDQVGYTPEQAELAWKVFAGRIGRYVLTSTIEVYNLMDAQQALPESAVDLLAWPLREASGYDYDYGEAKRRTEAVLARQSDFAFAAVRSAHVLGGGAADFTGRLAHYVERVREGRPVVVHPEPQPTVFVRDREIAACLAWAATAEFTGAVNANAHGLLDVRELAATVGQVLGREVRFTEEGEPSPFSFARRYPMDNGRAESLDFRFSQVRDWLPEVIAE